MMFLIEYGKGQFINAERIEWVEVIKNGIRFDMINSEETLYVAEGYRKSFVNSLQALNENIQNIESKYHEVNK